MTARLLAVPLPVRLAVTLWAVLLVAVGVRVAVQRPGRASVVPIYVAAGEQWQSRGDLYAATGLDVYRYPPGFAAAFAPLTLLPEKPVAVGVRLAAAAVFLAGLWQFGRATGLDPSRLGWLFSVAAVLSIPTVNNGQVNGLLGGVALLGTADAMRGRWWRAAGWFAGGAWVKVYPLAAGLLAAVARPRLVPPLAVVTVAGFALPFAVADPGYVAGQYRRFVESQLADDRTDDPDARVPRDWTVLPRTHLARPISATASKAVSLAVAVGLAGLVWWRRSLPLAAVLGGGWMTAFGPATEGNTYAALAGPAAWVCVAAGPAWARSVGQLGCGLLVLAVLRGAVPAVGDFELLGVQPVGAVLVMLAGVGLTRRATMAA